MFLGFSRLEMVLVRGYLGRLVGLGFKPNGFRPKIDSKKPIIHLKPVTSLWVKVWSSFFRSSLQPKDIRSGPSILAGTHGAFDETSSLEISTEEDFGSDLVLGLPEVGSKMSSKVHRLGNVVLDSTTRDGLDLMALVLLFRHLCLRKNQLRRLWKLHSSLMGLLRL